MPSVYGAPAANGFMTRGIADPHGHYYTRLFVDAAHQGRGHGHERRIVKRDRLWVALLGCTPGECHRLQRRILLDYKVGQLLEREFGLPGEPTIATNGGIFQRHRREPGD